MVQRNTDSALLHVRFAGRSLDIPLSTLDLGTVSDDRQVKQAVARYLDVADDTLRDYTVDRHPTGNMTLRPEAVFG